MIFYQISSHTDGVIGCELSKTNAHITAQQMGYPKGNYALIKLYVSVNTENMRRLIGNLGGYCEVMESKDD
jgi:hypothetical protein